MAVESNQPGRATLGVEEAPPAVRLEGVTKRFGDVAAVAGIDLEIADGEFFSMLGPSGSGKTTTLRMIAGFEVPTEGSIQLHGRDVTGVPPFDRDINTVFQDYALFPHMTVGDNVAYGLVVREGPEVGARSAGHRGDAHGATRGIRGAPAGPAVRRSAAAGRVGAGAGEPPRVLLLDEPLGALDLKLREEMQIELKAIQAQVGITFIYVTHDQEEALTMSNRLAVFNLGSIEQIGTPADVYEHPATTFVAGFVGTSNLLTGDSARAVIGEDGVFTVRPEKIRIADPTWSQPAGRGLCPRHGSGRSSTSVRTRDTSWRSMPVASSSSSRRTWRPVDGGACGAGPAGPAALEASPRAEPRHERGPNGGRGGRDESMRQLRVPVLVTAVAMLLAACSSGGDDASATPISEIGEGEGELNLVIWTGYAERGEADAEI